MIIDNRFIQIISNFGYRLRALICWLSPKLYNWLHPIKARVMFPGIGFHSNVHPTMCIWHGPSSELLIGSGFYPEYLGKGATQRGPFRRHLLLICKKHCQRHNGPRNWLHNLDWTWQQYGTISCIFGHQMAALALVANMATRWRHLH